MLGALILHNITPGPLLFTNSPELAWGVVFSYLFTTILSGVVLFTGMRAFVSLVRVPRELLYPIMIVFAVLGCYSLRNEVFDVVVLFIFGILGLIFERLKIPLAPFVIGFVLGGLAETQLRSALMWSEGSYLGILERPVAVVFIAIAAATLLLPPLITRLLRPKPA